MKFRTIRKNYLIILIMAVFLLLSFSVQAFAVTALYTYPTDPSGGPQLCGGYGVYLSDTNTSNTDYSIWTPANYQSNREIKAGVFDSTGTNVVTVSEVTYSPLEYLGQNGNGTETNPNIEIMFSKNITNATYLAGNKAKVTLWEESDSGDKSVAVNVTTNPSTITKGCLFVSPVANLKFNTSYKIKVASGISSNGGTASYSYEIHFKTKQFVSIWANDAALTATPSEESVQLSWPQPSSADLSYYQVLQGDTVIASNVSKNDIGYDVTGLTAATDYTFKVNAYDGSNTFLGALTATTKTNQATPKDTILPSWTDETLTVSNITASSVTLTWTGASDDSGTIAGYRVIANQEVITSSIGGSTTSYTVNSLTDGTNYTFEVEAKDAAGNWSTDGPQVEAMTLTSLGTTVSLTAGTPVNFEDGLTATTDQIGADATIAIRNATAEIPSLPYDLEPSHGSYTKYGKCYGVTVNADSDGSLPNKVVISVPVSFPEGTDLSKVGVHIYDDTPTAEAMFNFNSFIYQESTDLSEIDDNIIKFTIDDFDSSGKNIIFGVYYDPYPPTVTDNSKVESITDTSVTFKVSATDFSGISKFSIFRNGEYIGDNTEPIVREAETGWHTTITDTPPEPGIYTYRVEVFDTFGNYNVNGNYGCTVNIGGDNSVEAMQANTIAGLEDYSLFDFADGDSYDCVTRDFEVPVGVYSATEGILIDWTSDRPDILDIHNYHVYVTKPVDDETVVTLTATVSGEYASDRKTIDIPITVKWLPEAYVTSLTELEEAIDNPMVETILPDFNFWNDSSNDTVDINLRGKTLKIPVDGENHIFGSGNGTFRNGTIDASGILQGGSYQSGLFSTSLTDSTLTLDNIDFIGTENTQHIITSYSGNLSITNCTFGRTTEAPIYITNNSYRSDTYVAPEIEISDCTFNNKGHAGYAVEAYNGYIDMSDNTIKGYQGLINGFPSAGVLLGDDVVANLYDNTISNCTEGVRILTDGTIDYKTGYIPETFTFITEERTVNVNVNGITVNSYMGNDGIVNLDIATAAAAEVLSSNLITPIEDGVAVNILDNKNPDSPVTLYQSTSSSQDAPELTADTSDNILGQDIVITFGDNDDWTSAITEVSLDGDALASEFYAIGDGVITIYASAFSGCDDYTIEVNADGYLTASVTQAIVGKNPPALTMPDVVRTQETESQGTAKIYFTDDENWRNAITGIYYQNVKGNFDDRTPDYYEVDSYTVEPGVITVTFEWGNMSYDGTGQSKALFTIEATGYEDTSAKLLNILPAPTPIADTTGNSIGQDINITHETDNYLLYLGQKYYQDFDIWYMMSIGSVSVNGVVLDGTQCTVYEDGYIHIDGSLFPAAGNYTVVIKAYGYTDATVTQVITDAVQSQVRVKADSTNNILGQPITLTYATTGTDVADWASTITGITVNSVALTANQYTISDGTIVFTADAFPAGGETVSGSYTAGGRYTIAIQSSKYTTITVNQYVGNGVFLIAPNLSYDITNATLSNAVDITFTDNEDWRNNIYLIKIADYSINDCEWDLDEDQYEISAGNIHLDAGVFPHAGTYSVRVFANGYDANTTSQQVYNDIVLNPPELNADSSKNVLSQDIDITFNDANWRYYISGIKVNETVLASYQYEISAGDIKIDADVFTAPGNYTITVLAPTAPGVLDASTYAKPYSYDDAVVEQTIVSPVYSVTVTADAAYTAGESDSIKNMTVNSGINGFKYFTVSTTPVNTYAEDVVAVFTQFRDGVQIGISAVSVSCDNAANAKAGFNVQAGDIIYVYIVDDLTNDTTRNPVILQ